MPRSQKQGIPRTYVFSLSSETAGAGEGTGIPAAAGAILMARGQIQRKGVLPPEACVQPFEALSLALSLGKKLAMGSRESVLVEQIEADGTRTVLPIAV